MQPRNDVRCGQERGQVGAPGVRDDGAVSGCVVARYIRAQCADEVHVGVVDDSVREEGGMVGESDRAGREEGDGGVVDGVSKGTRPDGDRRVEGGDGVQRGRGRESWRMNGGMRPSGPS